MMVDYFNAPNMDDMGDDDFVLDHRDSSKFTLAKQPTSDINTENNNMNQINDYVSDDEVENPFLSSRSTLQMTTLPKSGSPQSGLASLPSISDIPFSSDSDTRKLEIDSTEDAKLIPYPSDYAVAHESVKILSTLLPENDTRLLILQSHFAPEIPTPKSLNKLLRDLDVPESIIDDMISGKTIESFLLDNKSIQSLSGTDKLKIPDIFLQSDSILYRELMIEELRHTARLQTLVFNIIEPLRFAIANGKCHFMTSAEHHSIFDQFHVVSTAQFEFTCSLVSFFGSWPSTKNSASLFNDFASSMALYADLANTIHYSTQVLLNLMQNTPTKQAFASFLDSRDDEEFSALNTSLQLPICDLLNEPFNHLPKYQYFVESMLHYQYSNLRNNQTSPENSRDQRSSQGSDCLEDSFSTSELSKWSETLATVQQNLIYITKCYQNSPDITTMREIVQRLGTTAPSTLRQYEARKLISGKDHQVWITDQRRKKRKRGILLLLSDCLLLTRISESNAQASNTHQISSASTNSSQDSSSTKVAMSNSSNYNRISIYGYSSKDQEQSSSLPSSSQSNMAPLSVNNPLSRSTEQVSSLNLSKDVKISKKAKEKMQKERKEMEKKEKLAGKKAEKEKQKEEKQRRRAESEATKPKSASAASIADSRMQKSPPSFGRNASASIATNYLGPAKDTKSYQNQTAIIPTSTHASNYSQSSCPFSKIHQSPLRFIAMLFFDQFVMQHDLTHDHVEPSPIVLWAFESKFTIEFETEKHKEQWLKSFNHQIKTKIGPQKDPFGKSLVELFSLSKVDPNLEPTQSCPNSYIYNIQSSDGRSGSNLTNTSDNQYFDIRIPNFMRWFVYQLAHIKHSCIDLNFILECIVPPKNSNEWKKLKKEVSASFYNVSLADYAPALAISFFIHFLTKMSQSIVPNSFVDHLLLHWGPNDSLNANKIASFISSLNHLDYQNFKCLVLLLHSYLPNRPKLSFISDSPTESRPSQSENKLASVQPPTDTSSLTSSEQHPSEQIKSSVNNSSYKKRARTKRGVNPTRLVGLNNNSESLETNDVEAVSIEFGYTTSNQSFSADSTKENASGSESSRFGPPLPFNRDIDAVEPCPEALVLAVAFAPAVLRPFVLKDASPTAVGNYLNHMPKLVKFMASVIHLGPMLFDQEQLYQPTSLSDELHALQLEAPKIGHYSPTTSATYQYYPYDVQVSATPSEDQGSSSPINQSPDGSSESYPVSSTFSQSTKNILSSSVDSTDGLDILMARSSRDKKSRKAKRGAFVLNFDVAGITTNDFMILHDYFKPSDL